MADQQQFCLRWNNHGSTLVAVFDNLLSSESLVDVTLFAEGKLLKAHKVVLSACSPYFQTLFAQTTDKHPIVILKDVKHDELKALLEYMYRGEVNVAQDQLGPLIKTAESLKIKGLADGGGGNAKSESPPGGGDARTAHPAGLDLLPKRESQQSSTPQPVPPPPPPPPPHSQADVPNGRPGVLNSFPRSISPQVSVPSVLSTVLTMPPALSLASSGLVPSIKLPSLNPPSTGGTPTDGSSHEDGDSPYLKRRKRMRRKSGEPADSADSDCRSSGSPGEGIPPHLPRIPATITPVIPPQQHQQQQHHHPHHLHNFQQREREQLEQEHLQRVVRESEREREREMERDREIEREKEIKKEELFRSRRRRSSSSPPSPENLVGSSSRAIHPEPSRSSSPGGFGRSLHADYERSTLSPTRAMALLVGRQDENSSDANHMSEDEYERPLSQHPPDGPGPSTSRTTPRPHHDDSQPPSYLTWPYPPDTSSVGDDTYSSLENANQGYNLLRDGLSNAIPPKSEEPLMMTSSTNWMDSALLPQSTILPSEQRMTMMASSSSSSSSACGMMAPSESPSSEVRRTGGGLPSLPDYLSYLSKLGGALSLRGTENPVGGSLDLVSQTLACNAVNLRQQQQQEEFGSRLLTMQNYYAPYGGSAAVVGREGGKTPPLPPWWWALDAARNNAITEAKSNKSNNSAASYENEDDYSSKFSVDEEEKATAGWGGNNNNSKLHICNRCGKSYIVRRSLHRHLKFECGIEPQFVCPVCSKRCSHKFNLKQHMVSHHKEAADLLLLTQQNHHPKQEKQEVVLLSQQKQEQQE